jgi:8-oxo-dGTP pyrophosphatase MutT (NUDIX family)
VCFRILSTGVEFLLVRTRGGRWTFPKGGVQFGLSQAQSAAIEAYEEAGVHGRIEETAFIRYRQRKFSASDSGNSEKIIHAHLCEVLQTGTPQEAGRNPTWFSIAKAKRSLAEGRTEENATELKRVVDRAVSRVRRLPFRAMLASDDLLKVRFESSEIGLSRRNEPVSLLVPSATAHTIVDGVNSRFKSPRQSGKIIELRLGKLR